MKTPPDSALADAQGIIADLRRQLAERTAERDEALAQQTATAEVLQSINSSPGDLVPVFDAMLNKTLRLCGGAYGSLLRYDGELFHVVAVAHGEGHTTDLHRSGPPFRPAPGQALYPIVCGEQVVPIDDVLQHDAYLAGRPEFKRMVDSGGYRSILNVALRKDGALFGVIGIFRKEVRPFSDKEVALLQNFAAQAVIAMENARLITETREALDQQTATAELLQVINSSPGDLAPVFDAMLEKGLRLCEASFGVLCTYDKSAFRAAALRGVPAAYAEFLTAGPLRPGPGNGLTRVAAGEKVVHVVDLAADDVYRSGEILRRALVDLGGARSALTVALLKDELLLGAFIIYRLEVRAFTEKQIALLQNFAAQAVIAMENARLITETSEALEQQTGTAEVLGVINSSPGDLQPVFDAILEKAHSLCGITHGSLQLYEDGRFRAVATRGLTAEVDFHLRQPREPGPALTRFLAGARFHEIADQVEAAAQAPSPSQLGRINWREQGILHRLFVPLRHDASLLGMIVAGRTEARPFSNKEIALLENFAAQAVIAMENARLLGELRTRTEEVAELNRGLEARVAEQVDELGRVGRLKRFLAPQLAELIVSQGDEKILESHRREIVVVFCDLRGYTAFTETAEPEEVLDFLREYHGALGPLVAQFEGTLDQFSGDGIMVFFNDPVPCPDPGERAVRMAVAMREAATTLIADWRERGRELGFGAGIAQGYATLGQIGFSERSGYTAIGTVCNVAARLCAEAKDGQILVSQRVNVALKGSVATEQVGALVLKGLTQPAVAYNVPLAASQPALRVIEGGPQSV